MPLPTQFQNVTAVAKANVYFDGKVVSHTLHFPDGSKKTLGLIYPGSYHFNTDAPEKMQIIDGSCRVKLTGESQWKTYSAASGGAGSTFHVPGKSSFDIAVDSGLAQYICTFE